MDSVVAIFTRDEVTHVALNLCDTDSVVAKCTRDRPAELRHRSHHCDICSSTQRRTSGPREMKKLACSCCDHREEFEMNTFEWRAHRIRAYFDCQHQIEVRFSCLLLVQCASRDLAKCRCPLVLGRRTAGAGSPAKCAQPLARRARGGVATSTGAGASQHCRSWSVVTKTGPFAHVRRNELMALERPTSRLLW